MDFGKSIGDSVLLLLIFLDFGLEGPDLIFGCLDLVVDEVLFGGDKFSFLFCMVQRLLVVFCLPEFVFELWVFRNVQVHDRVYFKFKLFLVYNRYINNRYFKNLISIFNL